MTKERVPKQFAARGLAWWRGQLLMYPCKAVYGIWHITANSQQPRSIHTRRCVCPAEVAAYVRPAAAMVYGAWLVY